MSVIFSILKWSVILVVGIGIAVFAFINFHPTFGGKPNEASWKKIQNSPHFNGEIFENFEPTEVEITDGGNSEKPSMIEWLSAVTNPPPGKQPEQPLPSEKIDLNKLQNNHFIWLGHSGLLFKMDNKVIVADPVFYRASPIILGGAPFPMEYTPISADFPEFIDIVVISHDHYDHLDYKVITEIKDKVGRFYVPLGVKAHLQRWGVADDKIVEMDWYEQVKQDDLEFTFLPSRHFSGRSLSNRNSTLWGAWSIKSSDFSLYFNGDSGYGKHFAQIGEKYGPFDLAFIENGAYNQNWALIHMFPEQSAQAVEDVKAKVAVPIHWAKFDLAYHNWKEPIERFTKAAEGKSYEVATPKIGQVFSLDNLPKEKWWEKAK
ncbi:L-ascorbate metabolism protein UlaG (beta-lactamase superfamily) [Cricetibacter osteomyelitidis]|uniref:L-ascorbate metabolism protein UlaG (Beta-lactamase superfamily) n=1 Tax=Cricetibacter osteomyelitidis TaxID=1521931 RepID=A0A4V2T1D9_9PAST|nr:MBL fold metallo-hydrolase [Cricetibacter osteomyelitidis]TCP93223.1 L-ascorbate metabolism protein UlaG (beta-lactamase superfamily) [Cricetibacter osteomyelitidis]